MATSTDRRVGKDPGERRVAKKLDSIKKLLIFCRQAIGRKKKLKFRLLPSVIGQVGCTPAEIKALMQAELPVNHIRGIRS